LDLDFEVPQGGSDAANDFAGPQLLAEEHERSIFETADSAEKVIRESFVVGIDATTGQLAFENRISRCELRTRAGAESFSLEAVQERFKRGMRRGGNYDRAMRGFAEGDLMALAEVAQAVEMAKEVERPGFVAGYGGKDAAPDACRIVPANGLAMFIRFSQLEADGPDVRAEVERFDFEEVHLLLREIGRRKFFEEFG
jgi:hypothetical protein